MKVSRTMNAPIDPSLLLTEKFAVGQPVSRKEDPVLLRGEGRYSGMTLIVTGQLYGVMVRSRVAHGIIHSIDHRLAAREMPGVRAVITEAGTDGGGDQEHAQRPAASIRDGSPTPRPPQRPLAIGKVHYVGEPIAMVVADTNKQAKDAAEAIFVDIDQLPAVTTASAAAADDAPLLHEDAPGNVCLDFHFGDAEKVAAAFAEAAHVTKLEIRNNRIVVCPMEPRSAIGEHDLPKSDRWTLRLGCQGVFGQRNLVSNYPWHSRREVARSDRQRRRFVRHESVVLIRNISLCPACRARVGPAGEMD